MGEDTEILVHIPKKWWFISSRWFISTKTGGSYEKMIITRDNKKREKYPFVKTDLNRFVCTNDEQQEERFLKNMTSLVYQVRD